MIKKISAKISAVALVMFPAIAFAQQSNGQIDATGGNIGQLLTVIGNLANRSIGILVAIALAVFFYGLVRYLFKLGGEKGAENGKSLMIYGIVALFVMVSVWGIITFISDFFGLNGNQTRELRVLVPTVNNVRTGLPGQN